MRLKIELLVLSLLLVLLAEGQQISVKSFRKLEGDLTARVSAPKTDQNGDKCAIIKVVTGETGFVFEPDGLGITERVQKTGEIWLYVPYGAKRLTIKHAKLGVLRDYMYGAAIEKTCVYEMMLTTGRVVTTVEEVSNEQWLVITTDPKDATVYIDEVYEAGTDGMVQKYMRCGKYTYRVTAPLYHTDAGSIEVTADKKAKLTVQLKPAFGYLSVNSQPESGARVFIDGEKVGETPYKSDRLKSGDHRVQVIKPMFQPTEQSVTVVDGVTTPVDITMPATFATVHLTSDPGSEIWVDGKQQGTGKWSGRLNAGVHAVEVRKEHHRTVKQSLDVQAGETKTVAVEVPSPIYGALNISSTPGEAIISLNGKAYGETPQMVKDILVGSYELKLSKAGYATDVRTITVEEGKTLPVNVTLSQGKSITLKTVPEGGRLSVDGRLVGLSPKQVELSYGIHSLKGEADGKTVEKQLEVKAEGGVSEFVLKFGFSCGDVFTDDRDGQQYPTVQVGSQCWMAKNLNYAGDRICYNDEIANCNTYGGLYTWEKAKNACPSGWHLPSDEEWTTLDKVPSGWNARLGGRRYYNGGGFYTLGSYGYWWSSTPNSTTNAWYRGLGSTGVGTSFGRSNYRRSYGCSVRCLRN